ncbi:hypothetical protein JOB18_012537 [Solea senegalensis]|uniref:CRAL-TRIO domain-containing protein n=1 Tax=Solea senegalensis TaxID=28829 RepID=A0AAV6QH39_SOLSE|nr:hypothetical protein JOB18_012537 [Solea senegalensis]
MEEYLRRVQIRLGVEASEDAIHAVLGGPKPDIDTVAATLCLALHLSQKETSGGLCLPVLCGQRADTVLPEETVKYLQTVKISESLLLWRDDVDLLMLHHTGKLSLTLLRDGLLESSENHALESSILRVVHHNGQQDTGDDGASFAVKTVAREIRQEAAEHIRPTLGKTLGEAVRLQSEALRIKHGQQSPQLEELRRSLELLSDVTAGQPDEAKLQHLEQLLTMELKEFTDGEMTIALSSVTAENEDWHVYVEGMKSVSQGRGLDGLVLLLSISDTLQHPYQQVAVYSNNTEILNQICCELEESSSWSLSGELVARENLQVYHIPFNTSPSSDALHLLQEEIQGLLKDFVDRRGSVLACHPSSRTSSTEGVAGSVEFSQGSSGINDMDNSDIDRAEEGSADAVAIARVMTDGEEDTGGVGISGAVELVSPDSGMITIRSSRSSKESSVFLSDDSPLGEVTAGGSSAAVPGGLFLRNPSPLGLLSLSPPVPPERRKQRSTRKWNDNFDLFSFDPLHSSDHSLPEVGELANDEVKGSRGETSAESSNLSELEELSLLDFSDPNSLDRLESGNSSTDHFGQTHKKEMTDTVVPPTPVNSLVEDVAERIDGLQHKDSVSSSLSETWDELGFDTQGNVSLIDNKASNRTKDESLQNMEEDIGGKDFIGQQTERETQEEMLKTEHAQKRQKRLEPQLSLVTEQHDSHGNWIPDTEIKNQWNSITLADLQLTPPEEEGTGKSKLGIMGAKEKTQLVSRKKAILNTLTPDSSKEEDEGLQGKKEKQMELLDFWTYSAQKGFLKSDSGTTTSYPESLDMWNMTIRDDSLSPITTPDNLSENSGSFCGVNHSVVGGTSVESPPGFSDGGMQMWNTTIQEDSSSTVTSPEGPENGKDLSRIGSLDANDSPDTRASKQLEEEKAIEEGRFESKVICPKQEEVEWAGHEHNVKIVIETADGSKHSEESEEDDLQTVDNQLSFRQNLTSEHSETETSSHQGTYMWELPAPVMVTSTSEYDNIGAGGWSQASSPETYASQAPDVEGLSSPFIAVTKSVQIDERHDQHHMNANAGKVFLDEEESLNQVFLFEGTSELGQMTRSRRSSTESEYDNKSKQESVEAEQSSSSPFVMVDFSSDTPTANYQSSPGEAAETQVQADQLLYSSHVNWDSSESPSSSHTPLITLALSEDETQQEPNKEHNIKVENNITEAMSLNTSFDGRRDTLKCSPDNLQPGSRDEVRSNSDGDSSSGLEMDYIVVSGAVKEAEREWHDRPKQGKKQTKRNTMETFSMLFYAATALQSQVQGAQREHQEDTEQSRQNQIRRSSDSPISTTTEHQMVPEIISPSQSKNTSEAFHSRPTGNSQTQVEEGHEDKSSVAGRSISPSLRYPSDNFLKTREEVYVHSQISMEDSDEGGQSPSAPPPCPPSLEKLQDWGGQLMRQDTPQVASETQSPVLTDSSASHSSSLPGTPVSESGISTERGLGLPFSGDLMEEENDEDEQEEEADTEHVAPTKWTQEGQSGSSDLLSFTEELYQPPLDLNQDRFQQDTVDYYDRQPIRYSLVSRHQDVSSHTPNETAAYQWMETHHVTQGQTQYGYNYHHIDQRTENQSMHSACVAVKSGSQRNTTDVYAEFTTDATAVQHESQQAEGYYEAGVSAEYSSDNPDSKFQYGAESQSRENSSAMYASPCSPYQADDQRQYETVHGDYQHDSQTLYQSAVQTEREDHARYVPEGYVHFTLSRNTQQRDTGAEMMMKRASSEEAAEEPDNREDPPSSADVSGSSNHRRKLVAPQMDVSLDRSEGSLLSEDALDTEDDALDTGDDLDINVDELDTSDEADSLELNPHGDSAEYNLGIGATSGDVMSGHGSAEQSRDRRLWRSVVIGEHEHRIDMRSIEPYKRVISHGGYYAEQNAIIVFAACFLPDSDCENYNYVMENLFLYVISTLELMVAEDYMIVYLNGATPRRRMPGFTWMKKCYQMIDRRLKKNLKMFIIVHPSWFIRTLLGLTRPFISSKFSSKIKYVHSLQELGQIIPMEYVHIPPSIVKLDSDLQDTASKADKRGNSAI